MNGELLAVLEHMERDKGIKKEILIEAVESALVSAVRRVVDVKPGAEVKVIIDRQTGKIKAFAGDEEVKSDGFGRIAASTAKQVIIQKIREAEKEVVFNEFNAKVGEIVSGMVYRFDKGNVIIDLLGKAEALLPKREKIPNEEFRQGQRIRAYLYEVRKEARGPQILLSRAHPNFVKKLFELEVPEIYEGIVEVRAISRAAGERTKIAVSSKDEKIDSVGSCVGMRGSRVKNIVSELHGERIDIVPYSEDTQSYIAASLSPAQVSEIKLYKDVKKAVVIVNSDQLSLAIGKHGQNVRLASQLIGWDLDIRTKEALAVAPAEGKKEEVSEEEKLPQEILRLEQLKGVGEKTRDALMKAGFNDVSSIVNAEVSALTEIKGIGKTKAEKLIEQAKKLLKGSQKDKENARQKEDKG